MANPLDTYFYNGAFVKYAQLLAMVLSSLQIEVEGQKVRLPLEYLGGLKNQDKVTDAVSQGLKTTLKFVSFNIPPEAVPNRNRDTVYSNGSIERPALPVELTYNYRLRFKKFVDMTKALEQLVFHFFPHLSLKYEGIGRQTENIVISLESYDWDNDWVGTGEEPSYFDLEFNIVVSGGHLYGADSTTGTEDGAIIKEVDIDYSFYENLPSKPSEQGSLIKFYSDEVVSPRFRDSLPLDPVEGAYEVTGVGTNNPYSIVIGSYTYIREGY